MAITITVTANHLKAYANGMHGRLSQVVRKSALDIQAHAVAHVAVDEGNLKGSIQVDIAGDGLSAEVSANTPYAARIEYGFYDMTDSLGRTFKQVAQPYMTPAAEEVRPSFIAAAKQELGRL